jgi:hypothetical protein
LLAKSGPPGKLGCDLTLNMIFPRFPDRCWLDVAMQLELLLGCHEWLLGTPKCVQHHLPEHRYPFVVHGSLSPAAGFKYLIHPESVEFIPVDEVI